MNIRKLLNQFSNLLNNVFEQAYEKLDDPNVPDETKEEIKKLLFQLNQVVKKEKD